MTADPSSLSASRHSSATSPAAASSLPAGSRGSSRRTATAAARKGRWAAAKPRTSHSVATQCAEEIRPERSSVAVSPSHPPIERQQRAPSEAEARQEAASVRRLALRSHTTSGSRTDTGASPVGPASAANRPPASTACMHAAAPPAAKKAV